MNVQTDELLDKFDLLITLVHEDTIVEDLYEHRPLIDEICKLVEPSFKTAHTKELYAGAQKRIIETITSKAEDNNQAILFAWLKTLESCANIRIEFMEDMIQVWMPVMQQLLKS